MRLERTSLKEQFKSGGVLMIILGAISLVLIDTIGFIFVLLGGLMILASYGAQEPIKGSSKKVRIGFKK